MTSYRIDVEANNLDLSEQVEVSQAELDRAIVVYDRITKRRVPDVPSDTAEIDQALAPTLSDGFWNHANYLKCVRGDRMVSDERGLPPGYAIGPTWRRGIIATDDEGYCDD